MDYLRVIEELTRKRMTSLRPPTQTEALEGQTKNSHRVYRRNDENCGTKTFSKKRYLTY